MENKKFEAVRTEVFRYWLEELNRTRAEGELSDNYSESYVCKWQNELTGQGLHCSFLCSIADWLDNFSDLLDDNRYDALNETDSEVLFRFYTKIMLIASEILEDFVYLHGKVKDIKKKTSMGRDLEQNVFEAGELEQLSSFINSVCKHKTERENYHVHNHHLKHKFEDFGGVIHENQISLNALAWTTVNDETTVLMPPLKYFAEVIVKLNHNMDKLLREEPGYRDKLNEIFTKDWKETE
ncbi:hypothetical protein [Pedobacter sp. P26]|uniref:hypothetical protein n=1 Tax=Pedobacter sp. P26 TaxID=3423956 RepID=UPI003D669781